MTMARSTWDEYFLKLADHVATRATCDRKHVGAVIVKNKRVVSTGYNGSPSGLPHCDDKGHLLKVIDGRESCIRTLHAESNALDDAGRKAKGGTLYCTVTPCYECAKRIINAGIVEVVIGGEYQSQNTGLVADLFMFAHVTFRTLDSAPPTPSDPGYLQS
jgi:dCMP deaminase